MDSSTLSGRIKDQELLQLHDAIRQFAEQVWQVQRLLRGFTDHGPDHTLRVIARIEEFVQDAYLSEDEAFVLLGACWLHDVCMQDYGLLEDVNRGRHIDVPLSLKERHLVRKQHASRIKDLLEKDRPIVLRGDEERRESRKFPRLGRHKRYIAEIAFGHSTAGFSHVRQLPNDRGPRGRDPFRFGLLAALLLVGDECDLDQSRAGLIDNAGVGRLHPISALHHLKHRYVTRSQIAVSPNDPNARQLEIVYNWPEGDPDVSVIYRRWIEGKILTQVNLVQSMLSRELGIRFDETKPFCIEEPEVRLRVEELPENILPFLHAERAGMDLADLEEKFEEIKQGLNDTPVHILVEPGNASALGAREVTILAIAELLAQPTDNGHRPYRLVEINVADDPTCTDPSALFDRIVSPSGDSMPGNAWEVDWRLPEQAMEPLQQQIEQREPIIVLLCNAHLLPATSKQFLARCLIPVACQLETLRIFVTADSTTDILPIARLNAKIKVLEMPRVGRSDVLGMLDRHTLYNVQLRERLLGDQDTFTQLDALLVAEHLAPQR